jgi:hypothetical protein
MSIKQDKSCKAIIDDITENYYKSIARLTDLQGAINKFVGHFDDNNLFSFKVKFSEKEEYFEFAEMLKEFIDENKISEYKKGLKSVSHISSAESGLKREN